MTRKYGSQEPRIRYEQDGAYSFGDDVAMLAEAYGLKPDPWQKLILNAWMAMDEDSKFRHTKCGLSVPRQNGKNALLEMRELYGLIVCHEKILHTAHRVDTAVKAFKRLRGFFTDDIRFPDLAEMVDKISLTNGKEAIYLKGGFDEDGTPFEGGMVEFSARTRGGARGASYGLVVFDEAQELTDEQSEAITSTLAASSDDRQMIYTGTPPGINAPGDTFARTRETCINKQDKDACWHEWSVEEVGDVTDHKRWYTTNPAMGYRIDEKFTETEVNTLSKEGFARERLGWWQPNGGVKLFDIDKWRKLGVNDARQTPQTGKIAVGVKFSVDGSMVSLAVAIKPKDGLPYVEGLYHKSLNCGISWISDFVLQRKTKIACVVIDGRSNTDTLVSLLRDGGYSAKGIMLAGTKGVIASATRFFNAYQENKITHFNQDGLNNAIGACMKRDIGHEGGWGFQGIADADVTLVEACSLAYWGVMTTKRNPARKAKVF
jgi:hypothetical protein